jgi:hypothetical protein
VTQTQPQQAQPGQYYDVPGVGGGTQWTDQYETTRNLVATPVTANSVPVNGILPFKQTDVVMDWVLEVTYSQTYTAGTSTLTASPYGPWNALGAIKLPIQNQYNAVDVENGIDLYIFNLIRPWRETTAWTTPNQYANVQGFPLGTTAVGYVAAANAQANLIDGTTQWGTASTSWQNLLRLPASITFDKYFDLALTGEPLLGPVAAAVSPQYMAGSTRIITPQIVLAQGSGNLDVAAVNIGAGTGTFASAGATFTFRRKALYSGNPVVMPRVFGWQYRWRTTRFTLNGVTVRDIPLPLDTGQLLCVYVRMWDPTASAGIGAPVNINTVSRVQVQYGSSLLAFDGNATELQADFLDKHNVALPPGVLCFDMIYDERGNRTNARALNTLTTAGILVHLEFTVATSATAYLVLGTESLVYVV